VPISQPPAPPARPARASVAAQQAVPIAACGQPQPQRPRVPTSAHSATDAAKRAADAAKRAREIADGLNPYNKLLADDAAQKIIDSFKRSQRRSRAGAAVAEKAAIGERKARVTPNRPRGYMPLPAAAGPVRDVSRADTKAMAKPSTAEPKSRVKTGFTPRVREPAPAPLRSPRFAINGWIAQLTPDEQDRVINLIAKARAQECEAGRV